jgi:hypothetical protein
MHGNLRVEVSKNCSGNLLRKQAIPLLRENDYIVKDYSLDGDAPKQFIKAYFFERDSTVRRNSKHSWCAYIAKTAEKWYPHESVIEYMINRIGQEMGLKMNEVKLVRANGQIRFLSKYFINSNLQLIHGAEICGEYLEDMPLAEEIANNKKSARELFTFEFIRDAIRNVFPKDFEHLLTQLVKMIAFDAIVGNNDRHFYNWGVIATKKKTPILPKFAPLYDSARGLYWNRSDKALEHILGLHKQGNQTIHKYILDASPRISIEENKQANHFQLVDFVKRYREEYNKIVNDLSCAENEEKVLKMLAHEFYPFFVPARKEIIETVLTERFKKITEI